MGGGNSEIVSIFHDIIEKEIALKKSSLLLKNSSTNFDHFITYDWKWSAFILILKFLKSSLPVPIYRWYITGCCGCCCPNLKLYFWHSFLSLQINIVLVNGVSFQWTCGDTLPLFRFYESWGILSLRWLDVFTGFEDFWTYSFSKNGLFFSFVTSEWRHSS